MRLRGDLTYDKVLQATRSALNKMVSRFRDYARAASTTVIYFGFALTGAATTMLGSVLPAISNRFGLSDIQGGYLFAAQFLSSTLGVIFSSRVAAKVGFKWTLVPAFLLIAAGILLLHWTGWPSCIFAIACYGVGLGVAIPTCNLHVAAINPVRRASALNSLNFVWTGGALSWTPLARLISRNPSSFLFIGIFVVLFTVVLLVVPMKERPRTQAETRKRPQSKFPMIIVLSTGSLIFLYVGVENAWAGWASSYAQRLNAGSTNWIWAPACFWGALLVGRAIAPVLLSRISDERLLNSDLVGATVSGLLIVSATSVPVLFLGLALAGLSLASVFPNIVARMTREFEDRPGDIGWMFACAGVGAAVLPWAVGAASSRLGDLRSALFIPLLACATMLLIQIFRSRPLVLVKNGITATSDSAD